MCCSLLVFCHLGSPFPGWYRPCHPPGRSAKWYRPGAGRGGSARGAARSARCVRGGGVGGGGVCVTAVCRRFLRQPPRRAPGCQVCCPAPPPSPAVYSPPPPHPGRGPPRGIGYPVGGCYLCLRVCAEEPGGPTRKPGVDPPPAPAQVTSIPPAPSSSSSPATPPPCSARPGAGSGGARTSSAGRMSRRTNSVKTTWVSRPTPPSPCVCVSPPRRAPGRSRGTNGAPGGVGAGGASRCPQGTP